MKRFDPDEIRAVIRPRRVKSKYGTWLQWHYTILQGSKVLDYDDVRSRDRAFTEAARLVWAFRTLSQIGHDFRDYRELVDEASI